MCQIRAGARFSGWGWGNRLKYLKKLWNRKERRGNKIFKIGGGAKKKRGAGTELCIVYSTYTLNPSSFSICQHKVYFKYILNLFLKCKSKKEVYVVIVAKHNNISGFEICAIHFLIQKNTWRILDKFIYLFSNSEKYTWSRLFKFKYLFSDSEVYLK